MAQAARQYYGYASYAGQAARSGSTAPDRRPDVVVIPGRRSSNPALQGISPQFATAFKVAFAAFAVLAILFAVRVWLSTATVSMLHNVDSLEVTLASAQTKTNELEIQHSVLAGSARISEEATKIGMVAPNDVKYIKVAPQAPVQPEADQTAAPDGTVQNGEPIDSPNVE